MAGKTKKDIMLGFVGLGEMGGRMVARLIAAGYQVVGYNRTKAKAIWLIEKHGMVWCETPREVAEKADFIFSMVTSTAAVQAITQGKDGILSGLSEGNVYIDMTTQSPEYSKELALQVSKKGAHMLDAPVSGSVLTLVQGKLSVMVGGDKEVFEIVKPILQDIGPKVTHVGKNGLAVCMKIATNINLSAQMLAFRYELSKHHLVTIRLTNFVLSI
uniref:6-phosphogluconate dehydrogenase NADP-binding domain-containing protein n=1 Tax=Aplanochytrium stocchinoi TaxID=215587 RepID=A0A7S3LIL0_9STRA|mmetsp:Transcript_22826/g.27941  ORF Transcript_22826/g.27941 Transcript_22826/m.27941 type:complete len:215 (-) Transcript_22826:1261-1905(-)